MAVSKFFYFVSDEAPVTDAGFYKYGRSGLKELYGQTRDLAREIKRDFNIDYIWKFDRTTLKLIGKVR